MKTPAIKQSRRCKTGRFFFILLKLSVTVIIITGSFFCIGGAALAQYPSPMQQWNYLNRVQAAHMANVERLQRERAAAQRAAAQRAAAQREAARREREYAQREAARREATLREIAAMRESLNKPPTPPPIRPIAAPQPRPVSGTVSKSNSEERQLRMTEEQLKETRSQLNALHTVIRQQQEKGQLSESQLKEASLINVQLEEDREWYKRQHEEVIEKLERVEAAKVRLENMYEPPADPNEILKRIKPTAQLIEESEKIRRNGNKNADKKLTSVPIAMRTWTSTSGKYSREAKYLSSTSTDVVLEYADGTTCQIDLTKLSADDRDYIKRQQDIERTLNAPFHTGESQTFSDNSETF